MFFHVLLTTECDLRCQYCFGKSCDDIDSDFAFALDYSLPKKIDYEIQSLATFCRKDPECVLSFYGGEPMLCLEEVREIMDTVEAKHFLVQTNGLHLQELEHHYTNRFHTILVSVDGSEALTDHNRGVGVYRKVVENLKTIRRNGFRGEIIARMTVTEETSIMKEVNCLLHNREFRFSSVHWQLDAGFWKNDFAERSFEKWVKEEYVPGIQRLARFWVDQMEKAGKVLKLYPFVGLMQSFLRGERSLLRCGSGWINYSILTDGTISPCPVMGGMKDFYLGDIFSADPRRLRKAFVAEPCTKCDIYGECGGRCLYANITKRWSSQEYALVCHAVRSLVSSLRLEVPRVRQLIAENRIGPDDFDYLKYNGCEIIP